MEDGVEFDGADYEVACVGCYFDDDVATGVEGPENVGDFVLFVVFDGDDGFFDVVCFDQASQVAHTSKVGHDGGEGGAVGWLLAAVDFDVADEEVAGVVFLVFEVEVGLIGFFLAADHEGGEADLASVDAVDGAGGEEEAEGVGEGEVDAEEEEEGGVVVAVGDDVVVDEEGEEDDDDTDEGGEEGVEEFLHAGFAEDVAVGSLHGVEGEPAEGDNEESEPEVGVAEDAVDILQSRRFLECFAEEEKCGPCEHGGEDVAEDVFEG